MCQLIAIFMSIAIFLPRVEISLHEGLDLALTEGYSTFTVNTLRVRITDITLTSNTGYL